MSPPTAGWCCCSTASPRPTSRSARSSRCWPPPVTTPWPRASGATRLAPGPPASSRTTSSHLVDDVVAIADELGADRYHIVGHDWGGAVAWLTAAVHADDVESLTALSTPHPDAINTAMSDPNQTQSQVSAYMAAFRAEGSENQFLAGGAEAFFTGIGIPQEKAAAYAEVLGTPEALGAGLSWYRANPLPTDARIGPVMVPTLYIWGDEDIAFARATAEATANYVDPDAYTFEELTGRGHWLPEEAPDDIAAAVVGHLDASM